MYPEIDLKIESEIIVPKERKLKAVWSYEAKQDLKSWHGINTNYPLADLLAQEMAAEIQNEIDREILDDLARNAAEAKRDACKKYGKHIRPRSITDDWEVSADA